MEGIIVKFLLFNDARGYFPVTDYLSKLNGKEKNKIDRYISILEEHGTRIGAPYVDHVDGKIWELRPGNYRILFFIWGNKMVATSAFRKKGQKTPESEKQLAKARYSDWIQRYGQR
ncbi:type II toxin-antitoxin system RelE/ParE family toxin [Brevibacillus brevis]|nr:type II toxin-antitoxin system RelE/ParE family toxin [Brevibacillus brevis]